MPVSEEAVSLKSRNVGCLSADANAVFGTTVATGVASAATIRGRIASVEGYLWNKQDNESTRLRTRLNDEVKDDNLLKFWLSQREDHQTAWIAVNVADQGFPIAAVRILDHIVLDIREVTGFDYLCIPATQLVVKLLDKVSNADRLLLQQVIAAFQDNSCANGDAPIQTVAQLGPPNGTYRIDREQLSQGNAPRYWTYRLQKGGEANGGILMETGIFFDIQHVRQGFTTSLTSVPLRAPNQNNQANGSYVRLSAPGWLRAVMAA